jgi:hypothetical protein
MTRLKGAALLALALAACNGSPAFLANDTDSDSDGDSDTLSCTEGLLECPPDVDAECSGAQTEVDLGEATPCDGTVTIEDDAPAGGFPVGETEVTFTATSGDATESCTVVVTVTDATAPEIDCASAVTVVRGAPDQIVTPPDPTSATDACDEEVDVTTSPAEIPVGVTEVEYTATDDAGLTATCTTEVTVVDGFAVEGLRVLSASLNGDDTTSLTIGWEPNVGGGYAYRVERAESPDGPWESVVSGAATLFTDAAMPADHNYYRVVTVVVVDTEELDGGATEPLHAYSIAASDYDLRDQSVPGVSFLTTLYGVGRRPVDLTAGPFPLIVLLHGNHGICRWGTDDYCETSTDHDCHYPGGTTTPNAEGMAFQAETLAAQGYIAVTISGNAMNCRDDYIPQRTQLILEHIRRWKGWNEASADPFGAQFVGAVDMNRVGLVGHSRGGDAASSVPLALEATPIAGVTVASIFAIAPTDYHATTPVGTHYAVLLPACDGDVSNLWGMDIYDRGLDPDDHVVRAQVFIIGANHNFFSTEWYSDDGSYVCNWGDLIGGTAQQGMLEATEGAWFNGTLGGGPLDEFVRAEGETPTSIDQWAEEDLDLRWSYSAPERMLVDEFEGVGTPNTNLLGNPNTFTGFAAFGRCYRTACGSHFIHYKGAIGLTWNPDGSATAAVDLGGLDASAYDYVSFRVVSRTDSWNDGVEAQSFGVRLADGEGDTAEVEVADVQTIPHLYSADDVREVLQTVRVPLADLLATNPDLDLAALDRFELYFPIDGAQGAILVTDIELAE